MQNRAPGSIAVLSLKSLQRIADILGGVDGSGNGVPRVCSYRRGSLRALISAGFAFHQHVVEIHSLRWTRDAHAATLPFPSPCAVARGRLAGVVAIGEHDYVANVLWQIECCAARRSTAPPRPDAQSPALRRCRSRCLRRPSTHRLKERAGQHRPDTGRASSSADRLGLCLHRRGQGRFDGWPRSSPSTPRVTGAIIAGPSAAVEDVSTRCESE